ncbi:MAG: DUF3108 domain-containing protein [candidate division WOR-3 bacterium]
MSLFFLVSALPFYSGETLTFKVKYGFISAGEMTLVVLGIEEKNGISCWHFRLRADGGIPLYNVKDEIHSWVSVSDFATVYYQKDINEGSYHKKAWIAYDPESYRAVYPEGDTLDIPKGALDPLAVFYYARKLPLDEGKVFWVPYHVDRRSEMMKVEVKNKERVKVPYGEFDCYLVEPRVSTGKNIFGAKGGLKIWFTADDQKLPVRVETQVTFGSMTAELKDKK